MIGVAAFRFEKLEIPQCYVMSDISCTNTIFWELTQLIMFYLLESRPRRKSEIEFRKDIALHFFEKKKTTTGPLT